MKEFSVYFKLISINIKNKVAINLMSILFFSISFLPPLILIVLSFFCEEKELDKWDFFLIDIPFIWFLILLIPFFIFIKKNYQIKEVGTLIIAKKFIIVKIAKGKTIFNIKEMSNIILQYDGYKYAPEFALPLGAYTKSGIENYISFIYNGEEKKYQFKSENPNDYKYIKKILSLWKKNGIQYEYKKT